LALFLPVKILQIEQPDKIYIRELANKSKDIAKWNLKSILQYDVGKRWFDDVM